MGFGASDPQMHGHTVRAWRHRHKDHDKDTDNKLKKSYKKLNKGTKKTKNGTEIEKVQKN